MSKIKETMEVSLKVITRLFTIFTDKILLRGVVTTMILNYRIKTKEEILLIIEMSLFDGTKNRWKIRKVLNLLMLMNAPQGRTTLGSQYRLLTDIITKSSFSLEALFRLNSDFGKISLTINNRVRFLKLEQVVC